MGRNSQAAAGLPTYRPDGAGTSLQRHEYMSNGWHEGNLSKIPLRREDLIVHICIIFGAGCV